MIYLKTGGSIALHVATGLVILLLSGVVGGAAAARCAPFPKVPWWGSPTHASISEYVDKRHGGNWKPYIASWRRNLQKLRDARKSDLAVAIKSRADKKKKIILRSIELDKYIEIVGKRLSVMRCLANEAEKSRPRTKPAQSTPGDDSLKIKAAATGKKKAAALGCLECHGESPPPGQRAVPDLAGQNEFYLIRQLKEFQSLPPKKGQSLGAGSRHSRIMNFQTGKLTEKDIWNLSAYFTSLSACPDGKENPVPPPAPDITAKCNQCHGPKGESALPDVPNVAGQNKVYLLRQLYAFRRSAEGRSKGRMIDSRYHYFISSLTRSMSDTEMKRLAEYYSALGCRR